MPDRKDKQEKDLVDKFLSDDKALKELKNSSEEDTNELMEYGVKQINAKSLKEFGEEFLEQMNLYPNTIKARDISQLIKKIEVETK